MISQYSWDTLLNVSDNVDLEPRHQRNYGLLLRRRYADRSLPHPLLAVSPQDVDPGNFHVEHLLDSVLDLHLGGVLDDDELISALFRHAHALLGDDGVQQDLFAHAYTSSAPFRASSVKTTVECRSTSYAFNSEK